MMIIVDKNKCTGCSACESICPVQAVQMRRDAEGFDYPVVDRQKCISCGACKRVCPILRPAPESKPPLLRAFACYSLNLPIRMESTSGGIFTAAAEWILSRKGTVIGAAFSESFEEVFLTAAETENSLLALRGSKYLQCRTDGIYGQVRDYLEAGRPVLFTGLPCQTEGLLSCLGKQYPHLYCMDMVCFGVPSPGVWQMYLNHYYKNRKIYGVVFKDKIKGWKNWHVKITTGNSAEYYPGKEHPYMKSFLCGINVRPSCFACRFKSLDRRSDLTISDCWGAGERDASLNDDRGLSALLVHSQKGLELFLGIRDRLCYKEYDPHTLMAGNWAAFHCVSPHPDRARFFEAFRKASPEAAFGYLTKASEGAHEK